MKRILITGADSYIGTSFEKWVSQYPDQYRVDTLDMRGEDWKQYDFSVYDVIFHVAGIAHVKTNRANKDLYYKVNTELAIETAKKAKFQGVKQFIFMSSLYCLYAEYLHDYPLIVNKKIIQPLVKKTVYGESKALAEQGILSLYEDRYKVAILRTPMVYGRHCKGNFPKLIKLAMIMPIFPDFPNKRSMLFIDNLCEFIRLLIDNSDGGAFFPQNAEYIQTSELVKMIAEVYKKRIIFVKCFNPLIYLLRNRIGLVNKMFGDCYFDLRLSEYKDSYQIVEFSKTITSSI